MKKKGLGLLLAFCLGIGISSTTVSADSFHGERPITGDVITVIDENGNVSEVPDEKGVVEDNGIMPFAETLKVVNFNIKDAGKVTNYTEEITGASGYTYGGYAADAAYLGTTADGKVRFMLAGVIGQVNAAEVQVVDKSSVQSLSYYYVSSGRLYHQIVVNLNSAKASVLDNGPAPSYLKEKIKYYSYDGHYFYTEENFENMILDYNAKVRTHAVNASNPFYNYFQFLPFRSTTNYSGTGLNTLINNRVVSTSKMKNIGEALVGKQNTYGANALLMTGIAANESAWGTSSIAQNKNNLFGLNAIDETPGESANYFESVDKCIKEYSERWLSKEYLNPSNWKYFGGFLGNKASGLNVKYASDPYWGEKAAAMAWGLDQAGGNKDVNKYSIGIKDLVWPDNVVNVRNLSSTASTVLYKTPKSANCAYIVLNTTPENKFYKIQSDGVLNNGRTGLDSSTGVYNFSNMYAYLSSDYLKIVHKGNGSLPEEPEKPEIPDVKPNPKEPAVKVPANVQTALSYSVNNRNLGWESAVKNGVQAGATGLTYPMEGLKVSVNGISNLGVQYSTHVSNEGWQSWVKDGQQSGTIGQQKEVEAVRISLTGTMASGYDIHYRAYVEGSGWQKYVSNGEIAGTTGQSKHIEAIQIILLKKETDIRVSDLMKNIIEYSTNVKDLGWMGTSLNGKQSGTVGRSTALTGIKIKTNGITGLGVEYSIHVPEVGWQSYVTDGTEANASGTPKQIEAIKIDLTGSQSSKYDIYYRVHAANYGWLGWAKNGTEAGTEGFGYHIEAIQIVVQAKGSTAPGTTENAFVSKLPNIDYSTHIENIGWQKTVSNGAVSGTSGRGLRLEAIRINLSNQDCSGNVQYSTHIQNVGWQDWKKNGELSGTSGEKKRLEAIKIQLTGSMAEKYDIYYRVHAQNYGWLDWAKNGEKSGTQGYGYRLEAIQIQLVKKGDMAPGNVKNAFKVKPMRIKYESHIRNIGWQKTKYDGEMSGTIGKNLPMEAVKISLEGVSYTGGIEYSAHVRNIGWQKFVSGNVIAGTTGKALSVEAIKVRLTGEMAENYDVYYRAHVQNIGWMNWVKNEEIAGTTGRARHVEAIEVKLVEKDF